MVSQPTAPFLILAWLLSAGTSRAEEGPAGEPDSASQRALAEVLFRAGRELMEQGKIAPACAKFAESHRLDPALGTLLNLAVCHETEGRLASAWAEYNQAATLAKRRGDSARFDFARAASMRLEGRFATVRVGLSPAVERLSGLKLSIDRRELGRASLDVPIPLMPAPTS